MASHGAVLKTVDPELPERFAESTDDGSVRLAVLGESSAFGMPFHEWLSVGKIVAWQLGEAMPERKFRLELLAEPGDTLAGQYAKLARLSFRPDAIIVYCGHNELVSEIPWTRRVGHYVDERPSILWGAELLAARVSPVCSLIRKTADKFRTGATPPFDLRPPLVDVPAYTPAELAARLADFRRRLEAIASYSERIGATLILVVPPSNDAQFEPNRSFLPAETALALREAFAQNFLAARSMENASPESAIKLYRTLLASQPGFAETHYRLGCLLESAGAWDEAYEHFARARDLDGLPIRALTSFQDAYRDVAEQHHSVIVDGQALFHALGPHGLLDDHLFVDAMHPSLWGHIALAQGILDKLHARRAFGWPSGAIAPKIDIAACAEHFGFQTKDWKKIAERGCMFEHRTASLRYDRSQRKAKTRAFDEAAKRIGRARRLRPSACRT